MINTVYHEHHDEPARCLLDIINECDHTYLEIHFENDIERVMADVVFELLNYNFLHKEEERRELIDVLRKRTPDFKKLLEIVRSGGLVRYEQLKELLVDSKWEPLTEE